MKEDLLWSTVDTCFAGQLIATDQALNAALNANAAVGIREKY